MATPSRFRRSWRSRAALASVSTVVFVGGVGALANADPANRAYSSLGSSTDQADGVPVTTVVVERVSRTIYLDPFGNVVAGPPDSAATVAGAVSPSDTTPGSTGSTGLTGAAASTGSSGSTASSAGAAAAPATHGSVSGSTPAPTGTGVPASGGAAKPTSPPVTSAPTPPTTSKPIPPPPTVPKCTGSKCP